MLIDISLSQGILSIAYNHQEQRDRPEIDVPLSPGKEAALQTL